MNAYMYYVNRIELIRKRKRLEIMEVDFYRYAIYELKEDIECALSVGHITQYQHRKLIEMIEDQLPT